MAITATFYKDVQKKLNSTKIPTYGYYSEIDLSVELKDVTNLFTPDLIITVGTFVDGGGNIINPMHYNYCYLPDFERYYYVRDWSWILGRWECSLEVDVLASFKTDIGASSLYVLRSYTKCDTDIIDTKYPVKAQGADSTYQTKTYGSSYNVWNTNIYGNDVTSGFFRVSIVNDDGSAIGAVSHYAISGTVMAELMNKLYAAPTWMNITDANISQDLQKMLFNPMQYITSVIWIPTGFSTTGKTPIHTIPYGWWSLTLTGDVYRITVGDMSLTVTESIAVAHHPQYATNYHWLQLSPYTTAALYFTPFGFIPLDTSKIYDATHIDVEVRVDVLTGKGTLILSSHKTVGGTTTYGGTFYTTVAQVGIPITIAQMSVDMSALGQASTWVGAAGVALATGGLQDSLKDLKNGLIDGVRDIFSETKDRLTKTPAGNPNTLEGRLKIGLAQAQQIGQGGIESVIQTGLQKGLDSVGSGQSLLSSLKEIAGDIGSAALAAAGTCSSSGSSGGFAALSEMLYIQWYFQRIVNTDATNYGYPLCQNTKINTLSGFVLCQNGNDLQVKCTQKERQAICAFMEAGFFYE